MPPSKHYRTSSFKQVVPVSLSKVYLSVQFLFYSLFVIGVGDIKSSKCMCTSLNEHMSFVYILYVLDAIYISCIYSNNRHIFNMLKAVSIWWASGSSYCCSTPTQQFFSYIFSLTRPGLKRTIYPTRGGEHYTTDAVISIWKKYHVGMLDNIFKVDT